MFLKVPFILPELQGMNCVLSSSAFCCLAALFHNSQGLQCAYLTVFAREIRVCEYER